MMYFPDSFFRDEIRDGFYVPGIMKAAWAAQLEVLEEIDRICKKYEIKYYAEYGTLLGAIRHRGYIPWDDDFDISMKREDINRFRAVAAKEMSEEFSVLSVRDSNPKYFELITRVVNNRVSFSDENLERFHGFPYIAGVDIFCLDYVPENENEAEIICEIASLGQYINTIIKETGGDVECVEELITSLEKYTGVSIDRKGNVVQQIIVLIDNIFSMYKEDESKYITIMPTWVGSNRTYKFPKEYYNDTIRVQFEVTDIPVPMGYDFILHKKYGDYMHLVKSGGGHDYPFFEAIIEELLESGIENPYAYKFDKKALLDGNKSKNRKPEQSILACVGLLSKLHAQAVNIYALNDIEGAYALLSKCQETAISMGDAVEKMSGQSEGIISILEEYCELLYLVGREINGEDILGIETAFTANMMRTVLEEKLADVEDSINTNLSRKREVVFLPFLASAWPVFEERWKEECENPENDVYVIPIPYFDKKRNGDLQTLHYEMDQMPKYVNAISYDEYDICFRHPDVIYIQNPYDEYNFSISVHPDFYSARLKNYCEKMIYIPYFKTDEISPTEERAIKNLRYYAAVPGVINADEVIVQSSDMRKRYIEVLTEFAGDDTKAIWEKKIVDEGYTNPVSSKTVPSEYAISDEWNSMLYNETGERRKVVLYSNELATMYESPGEMIEKLKNIFNTFKQNKDKVVMLWRPHPHILPILNELYHDVYNEYSQLIEEYVQNGIGIYDDSDEEDRAVNLADAFYGDAGIIAQKCRKLNKPVMIQNVNIIN